MSAHSPPFDPRYLRTKRLLRIERHIPSPSSSASAAATSRPRSFPSSGGAASHAGGGADGG
jgi:hypothetical protein